MKIRLIDLRIGLAIVFIVVNIMVSAATAKAQSATAQSADSTGTAEGRAANLTEKMKTELSLTDAQYPHVQAINLKYAQKNEEIFKGPDGRFAKFKALKSSQQEKNKEMKAVLDKDQYKKYAAMMDEMKSKAREQYKGRT